MSITSPAAPTPTISEAAHRATAFLVRLFPERGFDIRLWDGTRIEATEEARGTLVINSPGAIRRMVRLPIEQSLGEACLRGDYDLEGDVWAAGPALFRTRNTARSLRDALAIARHWLRLPRDDAAPTGQVDAAKISAGRRSRDWDREGVRYHYDVGNDFYALFLDRRMVYSCAYFPTGTEDLDTAQELKLEHICRKLRLKPGERLLDIGCGWGALAIHAARHYDVQVLGVTLSEQQHALGTERVAEAGLQRHIEIRCMDYRDIPADDFDKVASVGMFEHVGPDRLHEYFGHVFRIVRPGGLFLNHGIANRPYPPGLRAKFRRWLEPVLIGGTRFRERYVFPNGGLVPVTRANYVAEQAGFEVRDVENLREHYSLTLRHWVRRLEANREAAIRIAGERAYRLWRLYMGIASWQFECGDISVQQSLLQRPTGGPSSLPRTRADLYA